MGQARSHEAARKHVYEGVDSDVSRRYSIDKRIGRGCYGVIFEAREIFGAGCPPRAIKKILHAFRNQVDAQRTYREVSYSLAYGGHRNIVEAYDVLCSADDRHLYLVLGLMDSDLQKSLRAGKMDPIHCSFITYQLLRALKYIHSSAVMHRDVKPANVLLNSDCQAKIADFGWARSSPLNFRGGVRGLDMADGDGSMTEYAGTRWYRSPEVLLGGQLYTVAVDLWAVGCVVGEMHRRSPLLGGTSTIDMIDKIVDTVGKPSAGDIAALETPYANFVLDCLPSEPPRKPIHEVFATEPPVLIDFVQLCLQVSPYKRITAQEAMEHPYVGSFHNPDDEPTFGRRIALTLPDEEEFAASRYRDQLYADVIGFDRSRFLVQESLRREREIRDGVIV